MNCYKRFLSALVLLALAVGCSSKQKIESTADGEFETTKTVFVQPLEMTEKWQQMFYQINSDHVLTLTNIDLGIALNLDQRPEQREDNQYTIEFKGQVDGNVLRFNSDEIRIERNPKGLVSFVGRDDKYQIAITHYADSLKEEDVPVGDMSMQQKTVDSLSYFDIKLNEIGKTDTINIAFWGNFYKDHRLHGHWVMKEVNGFPDIMPEAYENKLPHMTILMDESRMEGFAGCNRFSGPFRQFGKKIDVSTLAMTRMHCDTRPDIISHLDKSIGYRVEGNRLIFEFSRGNEIIFEK